MCEGKLVAKFTEKPSYRDTYAFWSHFYSATRILTKLNQMLPAALQTVLSHRITNFDPSENSRSHIWKNEQQTPTRYKREFRILRITRICETRTIANNLIRDHTVARKTRATRALQVFLLVFKRHKT